LFFDKLATLQEVPHLLGRLFSHSPLPQSFCNHSCPKSLLQVRCAQAAIAFFRGVDLPSYKPVFSSLLLDPGTHNCGLVLLGILSFDLKVVDHRAHFLSRLHLEHAHIIVLDLAPLVHSCLKPVLAVEPEHLTCLLNFHLLQMGLPLVGVYPIEGLLSGGLVEGFSQDLATLPSPVHVRFPPEEDVAQLRGEELT